MVGCDGLHFHEPRARSAIRRSTPARLKLTTATATKTVLITGATRGIGLGFVDHYVKAGWNVITAARGPASADQVVAHGPSTIVKLDTSDEESILAAAKQLGGITIDLLINNAGIEEPGSFETSTKSQMMHAFKVNAVGKFLVT